MLGQEWSYGLTKVDKSGVFCCEPRKCRMHTYRQSIYMGDAKRDVASVHGLLKTLRAEWNGLDYDLLRHNCCNFSEAMCKALGVGTIPRWVHRLADAGCALEDADVALVHELHHVEVRVCAREQQSLCV